MCYELKCKLNIKLNKKHAASIKNQPGAYRKINVKGYILSLYSDWCRTFPDNGAAPAGAGLKRPYSICPILNHLLSHLPEEPHGSTRPVAVAGSPIS